MIELSGVCVRYGADAILTDCSLSVHPGEIVALVGENGCGKSTLGRVLCAAQLVDAGSVSVDGHDPRVSVLERLRVRALVGRICQDPYDQLVSSMVFDEVAFGPRNLGLDEGEVRRRVLYALERVGMGGFSDRSTTALSGGEQQRIAIAGVLAMEPRYIIFDESTSQLDVLAREGMRRLFSTLSHAEGVGVVLITHDPHEIALADRVVDVSRMRVSHSVDHAVSSSDIARHAVEDSPEVSSDSALSPGADLATEPVLEMTDISFAYGARRVLDHIDLSLRPGEVVMLAGPSGAGKSTLAGIAAGLAHPDTGSVRVLGTQPVPGSVGLAFQQPESQFFLDTVWDEVAYAPRNLSCDEDEVARRVSSALELVGLDAHLAAASPFELSGGQARRVALASILAFEAPVYVFDEPSAGLDGEGRRFAHRFAARLAAEGRAVLVITHDVEEWRPVATRELYLRDGALVPGSARDALEGSRSDARATGSVSGPSDCPEPVGAVSLGIDGCTAPQKPSRGNLGAFCAYTPDAPAARLDARVKIALLVFATIGVFAARSPVMLVPWLAVLCCCLRASRIGLPSVLRGMRPVAFILAFTLVANLVSCDGRASISFIGPVGIDPAGGLRGLTAVLRILLLVGFSLCVASSTSGTQLSDACVRLLGPLARLGVPVGPLGTVLSLALRFIPLVSEELGRIRLAQRARGADFDSGSVLMRIKVWASVLTPLMIGLFRRADRLAEAMAARCYDAVSAGRMPAPRSLSRRDVRVLAAGAALALLLVVLEPCLALLVA